MQAAVVVEKKEEHGVYFEPKEKVGLIYQALGYRQDLTINNPEQAKGAARGTGAYSLCRNSIWEFNHLFSHN
ncbi:hypothetical protein FACS1894182_12790 [Bacteroidia bacterium]|nr:hypothetical protein FACS1894182_12790 [Bacteroidia bacterium]